MIPLSIAWENASAEARVWCSRTGKACIHLLHVARGVELERALLCLLWCLVQEGLTCDVASQLLQLLSPSWTVAWRAWRSRKMKVEKGYYKGISLRICTTWELTVYHIHIDKESHELLVLAPPWCLASGPVCWQVLRWEKKKRYWNLCSPGSPACSPSSFWSPDGLRWLPSFLLFLIMTGPRGAWAKEGGLKGIVSEKGGQRREGGK